jgi:Malectin domain
VPTVQPFSTRISAGATENWVDNNDVTWESDKYFNNNGAVLWLCPLQINGTDLDNLYCKERYFNPWIQQAPFRYDIPVPTNGTYSVKLHFAEITYQTGGERIFDVLVGGKMIFRNLDIYKEVGYLNALIIPAVTQANNRSVSIELVARKENPKISAIEIVELLNYVAPPEVDPVFTARISAGATQNWEDDTGNVWESDKYFEGKGEVFWSCPLQINGTDLDSLYCKERYFNKWKFQAPFRYVIPVPRRGAYTVNLHFAEVSYKTRGERIFDVLVGGKLALGSLDIFAEVGYMNAFILPAITQTSNGFVTIELVPKLEHPKICAIEIIEIPNYIPPPTGAPVAQPFELLINSGGIEPYVERSAGKRTWMPDNYFIGGGVLFKRHYDVVDTLNDEVFHIERWGQFRYEIPLPAGTYELRLHFAELHWSAPNQRNFDVRIENEISFKNIDLVKMAGRKLRAIVLQYTVVVTDGLLSLDFTDSIPKLDQPKVSGIEVRSISASTKKVNPFPMLINCGGNTYVEQNSTRTWLSDRFFMYGTPYNFSADAIRGKITNEVYHTGRYGPIRYDIPAPVGRYEVILHFAGGVNATYSDISLEATVIRNRVNIGSMGAGLNWRPATIRLEGVVTDGLISLTLSQSRPALDATRLSGIAVNFLGSAPTMAPVVVPARAPVMAPNLVPVPPLVSKNCTIPQVSVRTMQHPE